MGALRLIGMSRVGDRSRPDVMSAAEVLLALAMATAVGARWSTCTADAGTAARVRGGKGISKEGGAARKRPFRSSASSWAASAPHRANSQQFKRKVAGSSAAAGFLSIQTCRPSKSRGNGPPGACEDWARRVMRPGGRPAMVPPQDERVAAHPFMPLSGRCSAGDVAPGPPGAASLPGSPPRCQRSARRAWLC